MGPKRHRHRIQGVYELRKKKITFFVSFMNVLTVTVNRNLTYFPIIVVTDISVTLKLRVLFLNLPPYGYLMHKESHILLYHEYRY